MANEYKLSYTANEIDKKLGKIDSLVSSVNGKIPDANGNVNIEASGGSCGIIDVLELPTENINTGAIYRLMTTKFVSNYYGVNDWKCYIVDALPEIGEPVTTDMIHITGHYNIQDNEVYGYVDSMVSAAGGVPIGWYPIGILGQAFDITWGGVIKDIEEMDDNSAKVLLSQDYYLYQDGWCKLAMGYEGEPEFDIRWDGVVGDKFSLDMSLLGYSKGLYLVKVSDEILNTNELLGSNFDVTYYDNSKNNMVVTDKDIDSHTFAGAIDVNSWFVIVYSADETSTALGLPSGYITNGIYFLLSDGYRYVSRLVGKPYIKKIDSKFLPDLNDGLHVIAISGDYNDLSNKPTIYTDVIRYNTTQSLSSTNKSTVRKNIDVYSKSEVQTMIDNAIGNAIGGEY